MGFFRVPLPAWPLAPFRTLGDVARLAFPPCHHALETQFQRALDGLRAERHADMRLRIAPCAQIQVRHGGGIAAAGHRKIAENPVKKFLKIFQFNSTILNPDSRVHKCANTIFVIQIQFPEVLDSYRIPNFPFFF